MRLEWDVPLLTVQQAAKHAGVSRRTITEWIRGGLLTVIPEDNERLVRLDQLGRIIGERSRNGGRLKRDTVKILDKPPR